MKKTIFAVLALLMMFSLASCLKDKPITHDVTVPTENETPVIPPETDTLENITDGTPAENIPQPQAVKSYTSTVNNNLNGATVLYADDFYIYNDFLEDPENEYTGGEHRIYRVRTDEKLDGSYIREEIYAPYFAARNMCIYDNKLYFTSGGGGGRHLIELDLNTLESKELHDNLSGEYGYFVDSLQLVGDKLYFECNGSIYRMKPDQSEFEVLMEAQNDFSSYMLGVMDDYVFYQNHNAYQLRRIDIKTGEDTLFLEDFVDGIVNFYNGRVYYTDGNKLMSSDIDGIEIRTVLELEENQRFHAINISDGYVYYVINDIPTGFAQKVEYQTMYEYNLNGGGKRLLREGMYFYQLIVENGKLFFYERYPYSVSGQLKCIDPATLLELPIVNGTVMP